MNKISKLFQPISIAPKDAIIKNQDITAKSHRFMIDLGLIRPTGNGSFHILPLAQRSVDKCIRLIDFFMKKCDAQKVTIPLLTSAELWKKSGRFEAMTRTELLTTKDRHEKIQILGPTHEESVTALLATISPVSYRQFPLRLYQIGYKFRDELKPRLGLMRAKEFLMKDCYSFDVDKKTAMETYELMRTTYKRIFETVGIPFVDIQADTGHIGGSQSHEYQIPAQIGEDLLVCCKNCSYAANVELCENVINCPQCKEEKLKISQGIEVAHTFLLEDKYSKLMGATFLQSNGKPAPLIMGCYGIGITRLIAAGIECKSTDDEMRWPVRLAPYTICIIPPKGGSKEELAVTGLTELVYKNLSGICDVGDRDDLLDRHVGCKSCADDIIIDDRSNLTIGKRLLEAKRFGYPIIIVIGPKAADSTNIRYEYHLTHNNSYAELSIEDLLKEIRIFLKDHYFY